MKDWLCWNSITRTVKGEERVLKCRFVINMNNGATIRKKERKMEKKPVENCLFVIDFTNSH